MTEQEFIDKGFEGWDKLFKYVYQTRDCWKNSNKEIVR